MLIRLFLFDNYRQSPLFFIFHFSNKPFLVTMQLRQLLSFLGTLSPFWSKPSQKPTNLTMISSFSNYLVYTGDLDNEHLNKGNLWIKNFHLFAIQMLANSSLFKPSVTQPICQTPYDLNNKLLVRYSSRGLNKEFLVCYSGHGLNEWMNEWNVYCL